MQVPAPIQFKNHRAVGIAYENARWQGGAITPEAIIVHDTASWLTLGSAQEFLRSNSSRNKPSAHFCIEALDTRGTRPEDVIVQMVAVNKRANHAGTSVLHGRDGCNFFTAGIEHVNYGLMTYAGRGQALTWFGHKVDIEENGLVEVQTRMHGKGWWMPYPTWQLEASVALMTGLMAQYKTIRNIYPHWYVSPGRKIDTNPLFPLDAIRAKVLGRDDPDDIAAEEGSEPTTVGDGRDMVRVHAPGDTLNMRRWPSFHPNVLLAIPHGTELPVLRSGIFAWGGRKQGWIKTIYGGQEGWIVERYTRDAA